ncbi:MAG: hypothetical protein JOZ24_05300 [Candidatus Eremiobacteraeota bacterium]|nr:hypothetical protein [Candidatus Eremiobacteraeota bacterium]
MLWTGASSWRGLLVATTASAAAALWLTAGRITTAPLRRAALTLAGGLVMGALFVVLHRLPTQPPNVSIADARAPAIRGSDQAGRILQYRNELPQISALDLRIEIEKVPLVAGVLLLPACALAARERRFSRPVA